LAVLTTEDPPFGLHGVGRIDHANAIGTGALHGFDIDAHLSTLVQFIFGFQHMVDHIGEHGLDVAIRQRVEDVATLASLFEQAPGAQQPEMLQYQTSRC